jgi:hypothetical protein
MGVKFPSRTFSFNLANMSQNMQNRALYLSFFIKKKFQIPGQNSRVQISRSNICPSGIFFTKPPKVKTGKCTCFSPNDV